MPNGSRARGRSRRAQSAPSGGDKKLWTPDDKQGGTPDFLKADVAEVRLSMQKLEASWGQLRTRAPNLETQEKRDEFIQYLNSTRPISNTERAVCSTLAYLGGGNGRRAFLSLWSHSPATIGTNLGVKGYVIVRNGEWKHRLVPSSGRKTPSEHAPPVANGQVSTEALNQLYKQIDKNNRAEESDPPSELTTPSPERADQAAAPGLSYADKASGRPSLPEPKPLVSTDALKVSPHSGMGIVWGS